MSGSLLKYSLPARVTACLRSFGQALLCASLVLSLILPRPAMASRIKDVVDFEGVRSNMLIGYGLVVGLNGTGDSLRNAPFTRQSLESMLERLGVNTRGATLNTNNIAAVMVTANLPPFAAQGTNVDVAISAMGDAKSLRGGMLLVTPLMGADSEVYAVAQGPVSVGGFSGGGQGAKITKGVPTNGKIANGAIVERSIDFALASMAAIKLSLRNPDFTTAQRITGAINGRMGKPIASLIDPSTVNMIVPENYPGGMVSLITDIEQLQVTPDQPATVVIDEASGIIVMGKDVRINTVAIAQGNLTIRVTETPQVSQPAPFSQGGTTKVVPRTTLEVDQGEDKKLALLKDSISLDELVNGLNALGIGPSDMISILQAIKASGALQAEIEVM
ncbi:MAG: flagellar P-ring protein FlgI [Alphaproteobacteria bacterium]|nr:flagellar P-ring protein FlgI [Alphaproteobacteria bacterium]